MFDVIRRGIYNLEKEEFFSLIEDLKSKAKDNPEDLEILEDAFPFIKVENQLVEKNLNNQENFSLENQLIVEIQNPEQTDGKISVIDMRTENVAKKIENPENSLITKEAAKKRKADGKTQSVERFNEIFAVVPIPISIPNAKRIDIIGIVIPTPVKARDPTSGIRPINILSPILY